LAGSATPQVVILGSVENIDRDARLVKLANGREFPFG
jgi:NADH dehydrogenase FAD-containing subunit